MNIATTKTRKVRELIDTETRADIIRKVRENSAIVDGKRRTIVKTAEIAKEFGVRREYVTNALNVLSIPNIVRVPVLPVTGNDTERFKLISVSCSPSSLSY